MIVYRITKERYAGDLSGEGARKVGGRWNSKGYAVVYTGQSRALAALEMAVHIPFGLLPSGFKMTEIEVPETFGIHIIDPKTLPKNWKQFPFPLETQKLGNTWLNNARELIMKVPSVLVEGEFNLLLNPLHPQFSKVKIISSANFEFDYRLFA